MSLINLRSTLGYHGEPPKYEGGDSTSKLHYEYSVNGNPSLPNRPVPTSLSKFKGGPLPVLTNPETGQVIA